MQSSRRSGSECASGGLGSCLLRPAKSFAGPPHAEGWSILRNAASVGSRKARVVCAVGDVSAEGTNYLIIGAVAIALVGTAFPILFSRKDTCPVCDGAGFVRRSGERLNANAATKGSQIVCSNCKGLGKIGQTDKA
eukprot:SM000003S11026  [mRNA]  locus=s3:487559:488561:- [translate_table: standard]